jgi:aspartyl-tRNA(Asn)/glutamyl-tRNA(Gln) amidotransferase subunit A
MSGADVAFLTIQELAGLYRAGQLSPVEVVRGQLDRIARLDPALHAFLLVLEEPALAAARAAERELGDRAPRSLLHGVPVGHKDIYDTRGVRTTAHARRWATRTPEEDATAVARWTAAGAITLGKLNTYEFAIGGMEVWGFAANPHDPRHVTGGSSTGSGAALAAGLCYGATGSDTGGSIRSPAALCGVVGLKPTYGRVSRHGVAPLSWTLDHCGPMARTVADCAVLLGAMAGHDPRDRSSSQHGVPDYLGALVPDCRGLRVGVPRGWFFADLDPETDRAVTDALTVLAGLGATVVEVTLEDLPEAHAATLAICFAEAYSVHEKALASEGALYGTYLRRRVLEGGLYSAAEYLRCLRMRELFIRQLAGVLEQVDVLVTPATLEPAYRIEDFGRYPRDIVGPARPANLAGVPALVLPCGFSAAGLPIGLQIIGRWWDEATVLRVGHAYEQATPFHRRRPALAQ